MRFACESFHDRLRFFWIDLKKYFCPERRPEYNHHFHVVKRKSFCDQLEVTKRLSEAQSCMERIPKKLLKSVATYQAGLF